MGAAESNAPLWWTMVQADPRYDRLAPVASGRGSIHMLIVGIDYHDSRVPLTATTDARNMENLAKACEVRDLVTLYDQKATVENVLGVIHEMGKRCVRDDYFIFYFAGHGVKVEDLDGDDLDEAFVLVNDRNQVVAPRTFLVDDDFARCMTESLQASVRVLVLTDCCHSGTITDLESSNWDGREAVSIAGCLDHQTSGDTGRRGIFTHSMLLAIDKLQKSGQEDYSVGLLHNATVLEVESVFQRTQNVTIQTADSFKPCDMAWPLIPLHPYGAPLRNAHNHAARKHGSSKNGQFHLGEGKSLKKMLKSLSEHELHWRHGVHSKTVKHIGGHRQSDPTGRHYIDKAHSKHCGCPVQ